MLNLLNPVQLSDFMALWGSDFQPTWVLTKK